MIAARLDVPRTRIALAVGLAAVTAAVFGRALGVPFIGFDDPEYVTQNAHVLEGLTPRAIAWALGTGHAANWHPLTWLSHLLDVTLFGLSPAGHHATSVALHCVNAALLLVLLARLTGAPGRSLLAAALFALHPLRVESVAWIAERKDVLSGFFWLATTLAYVAFVRARTRRRYLAVVALLALGLASKPTLVTLPFALLLLDAWPLGRLDLAHPSRAAAWPLVREKLPLFALSAASSAVTLATQGAWGALRPMQHVALPARIANAVVALVAYLAKTAWPASLAVFYPYPAPAPPPLEVGLAAAALLGATALAWRARRTHPFALVGWLWFAGTLVPVLGLVQVGAQSMADRYTYVPSIGIALIVAWAIPAPRSPRGRAAAAAAATLALAILSAVTIRQLGFWQSERRLFEHAADVTEGNWVAETAIGTDLERTGDAAGAIAHYRRALAFNPAAPQALHNLGNALVGRGETREGIAYLREAVRLWPRYVSALANLGAALCETRQLPEGLAVLAEAVRLAPDHVAARYNLAMALLDAGRTDEALAELDAVVRLAPSDVEARAQAARLRAVLAGGGR